MRQRSIEIDGLSHAAPIPLGSRVGPILATSAISGQDVATGKLADGLDPQTRHAFANLKLILEAAGMDIGDVVKITVFTTEEQFRETINKVWIEHFPDPHHRPARHVIVGPLRGGALVQLEALAVAKDATGR